MTTTAEQKNINVFNQEEKLLPSNARYMTTLNIQGADPNAPVASQHDSYHHSSMLSTSLYAFVASDKTIKKSTKLSDDKVVSGYTEQGLPFLIEIDGYFGGETSKLFPFINSYIVPLISIYIKELQISQYKEKLAQSFIKKIFELRTQHNCPAEFTLSLAVTYQDEKSNEIRAAGFGVGDCGIILRNKDGHIKQLVHNQVTGQGKDGFDAYCSGKKRNLQVISRSDIFDVPVERGDEILGYTHLPNGMESKQECKDFPDVTKYAVNSKVLYMTSKDSNSPSSAPLFDLVWAASMAQHENNLANAQPNTKLGDDASLVAIKIPSAQNQQVIKADFNRNKDLFTQISEITDDYQTSKCCCKLFRNNNRPHQLQFIENLLKTQPSLKVMQGALLLVLFDIQHTQYAFTARNSHLRTIVIDILEKTGISFNKDTDKLVCPEDLKLAEFCYKSLDEHTNMYRGLKINWVNNACQEMTNYFKQPIKPSDPLRRSSFK